MNFTLRPFSPEYQDFLFQLYASTRQQEIAAFGWPPAQQEAFLRMQFNVRERSYESAYPEPDHRLIFDDQSRPIGRMLLAWHPDHVSLVDIALLPEYRGHGIGTQLLRELLADSDKKTLAVRLQVLRTNPAARLYERLGFTRTGEDQMYYQMEYKKPGVGP